IREQRSSETVEDQEAEEQVCFVDTDCDNFKVVSDDTEDKKKNVCIEELDQQGLWTMFFDGACAKEGSGAGVIFLSPTGKLLKFSFLLRFDCTNNIAEYEALLLGLNIALKHGIKMLRVFGDSELIVSQIRDKYASKNKRLKQYKHAVWDTIELFDAFSIG
ncbi:MAG TPA: ribonuclease HI family protein, partial [Puia sp.]|nr:ribonuclease HI family protein [Puia sp.]